MTINGIDPFSFFSAFSPDPLRTLRTPLLTAIACAAAAAPAQDLIVKAPPQPHPIAIVNAAIYPVSSPPIERGFVVFDGGVITQVGGGEFAPGGASVEVIDAGGMRVYPGMIGAVTQIGLTEIAAVRATLDYREVGDVSPEVWAAVSVNPDSTIIPVTRSAGVLTVGSAPTGGLIPGRMSVLQLEGWTWEEMTVEPFAGLMLNWPNMRPVSSPWIQRSEEEQQRETRERLDRIDEVFDTARAYLDAKAADESHPTDLRWEAMRAFLPASARSPSLREGAGGRAAGSEPGRSNDGARRDGAVDPVAGAPGSAGGPNPVAGAPGSVKPVFISAQDYDQITAAVTWAAGRGLRPVIVGGRDAELAADLLREHDVPVVITGTHVFPKRADSPYDDAFTLPERLRAAGVRFCIASADRTAQERNLPYNAAMAAAHGLDPAEALRAVTLSAAEILGVSDRLGSLEAGKRATLFLADGDPLEITTNVHLAFIEGRAIDLANKQTQLRDKYREKYRQQR